MTRPTTRRCRTCKCIRRPEMNTDCCSSTHSRPPCRCFRSMSSQDNQTFFTEWEETYESFDQMGLHENLLRGIYAYGEQLGHPQQAFSACERFE